MRRQLITYTYSWIPLLVLALVLSSCMSDHAQLDEAERAASRAQLQLQINTYLPQEGLRFETQLTEVRLMLFEVQTGACMLNEKLRVAGKSDLSGQTNKEQLLFDALAIEPGTYDLVLLANENSAISDLTSYRTALKSVRNLTDLRALELRYIPYTTAQELNYTQPQGPLLMSAYKPGIVVAGGTLEQPQKIKASLVSALSMVEVVLRNKSEGGVWKPTPKRIHEIRLRNLPKHYSNPSQVGLELADKGLFNLRQKVELSDADYKKEQIASYRFFVPELLRHEPAQQALARPLVIEVSGIGFETTTHQVVLQTDTKDFVSDWQAQTRLFGELGTDLRLEKEKTNNTLRNTTYRLIFMLSTPDKALETQVEVLPWTLSESERDFGPADFKVDFEGGKTDPQSEKQILTSGQTPVQFILDIEQPQGAPWRVALTNGLDFKLRAVARNERDLMGATEGIVRKGMRYIFEVVPTKPFDQRPNGIPRYTEIYLVIDGKEEQIVPSFQAQNKPSGPSYRYRIKQIE